MAPPPLFQVVAWAKISRLSESNLAWAIWVSLSENSRCPLLENSPKRELVAWARDPLAWARVTGLSKVDNNEFGGLDISFVVVVGCMIYLTSPIQSMKYVDMHEISDCMDWIDEFDMISACDVYGMVGYGSDMEWVWIIMLCGLLE